MDEEERQRNREAQENERLVMESIFEKDFTVVEEAATQDTEHTTREELPSFLSGRFVARPDSTAEPRQVCFVSSADDLESGQQCHVRHLPPFRVKFAFPETYPFMGPPEFQVECWWLSRTQLSSLKAKLIVLWEEERDAVSMLPLYFRVNTSSVEKAYSSLVGPFFPNRYIQKS